MASLTINHEGRLLLFQRLEPGTKYELHPVKTNINGEDIETYELKTVQEPTESSVCWHCSQLVEANEAHDCPHFNS